MEGTTAYTGMGSLIGTLLGLTAVLLLAYWAVWYLGRRMNVGGISRHIKIADRMPLGGEKQLLLVRVGGKTLLLGVTARSCETLCDLSGDTDLEKEWEQPSDNGSKFSRILENTLSKMNPSLGKGREDDG